MQKGQDEDVPRAEENNETRQEVEIAPEEVETPKEAEKDAEIQELAGKEEQLAGSSSTDVEADGLCLTKKEDSAEDGLGNRFVMITRFGLFLPVERCELQHRKELLKTVWHCQISAMCFSFEMSYTSSSGILFLKKGMCDYHNVTTKNTQFPRESEMRFWNENLRKY